MSNRGLPRLTGGIWKREREAWTKPCSLERCDKEAAGLIYGLSGPKPVCAIHAPLAEHYGYRVHYKESA